MGKKLSCKDVVLGCCIPQGRHRAGHRSLLLSVVAILLVSGCGDRMVAVSVTGYNHMPKASWSISGFSVGGGGGPNLQPETGGGGFNCCVSLPKRWRPGMKTTVAWSYDVRNGDTRTPPPPQEAEVEIPDYSQRGPRTVQVHFYPDHRIKLVVSSFGIEHPRHPLSEQDKLPWKTDWSLLTHSSMHD